MKKIGFRRLHTYDFIYLTFSKWQNYSDKEQSNGCQWLGFGEGVNTKGDHEGIWTTDGTVWYPDCGGSYTHLFMC